MEDKYKSILIASGAVLTLGAIVYFVRKRKASAVAATVPAQTPLQSPIIPVAQTTMPAGPVQLTPAPPPTVNPSVQAIDSAAVPAVVSTAKNTKAAMHEINVVFTDLSAKNSTKSKVEVAHMIPDAYHVTFFNNVEDWDFNLYLSKAEDFITAKNLDAAWNVQMAATSYPAGVNRSLAIDKIMFAFHNGLMLNIYLW